MPAGGLTRAEIAQWLQGHGYKAKIHDDSSGTSIVTSASDGLNWDIYVYECNGAGRCPDLQYAAGWSGVTVADDTLNTWNRDNRYIRAYQGEKGSVWGVRRRHQPRRHLGAARQDPRPLDRRPAPIRQAHRAVGD
uniref:YbjN domain-containing protein n=1 Tax=Phenylobacterium glaciei TaxID=2803784 RepID=A0A974P676_9CAUL|nr:YbjN domain-containing protein [Phenylobacterium glaciei]